MLRFLLAIVIVQHAYFAQAQPTQATERKPNIVVLLTEELGYADLGCYGQKTLRTPGLDAMAKEGIRFTQFYAGSSLAGPSRCVFLLGRHGGKVPLRSETTVSLRPEEHPTIATLLKRAGYATGYIGNWGLSTFPSLRNPNELGFDHFFGQVHPGHSRNSYPPFLVRNGEVVPLKNELAPEWRKFADPKHPRAGQGVAVKRVEHARKLLLDETLRFIHQHENQPFFLCVTLAGPSVNPASKSIEVSDLGEFAEHDWPTAEKAFASALRDLDREVGKVLDTLRERKLDKDTLVIFTSLNGPHQDGGHRSDFFQSTGKHRGGKGELFEGSIRVPMIAWWPGQVTPETQNDLQWYVGDLLATAAELSGSTTPSGLDSDSLVPALRGKAGDDKWRRKSPLYWQVDDGATAQAVRFGKWKAIRTPSLHGEIELYDMSNDVGEKHTYAKRRPDLANHSKNLLNKHFQPLIKSE
jgi:arylsulfatase A-like enzyme